VAAPFVPKEIPVGIPVAIEPDDEIVEPVVSASASMPPTKPLTQTGNLPLRGSLADSIAKSTTVTQTELLPPNKANGVQRF